MLLGVVLAMEQIIRTCMCLLDIIILLLYLRTASLKFYNASLVGLLASLRSGIGCGPAIRILVKVVFTLHNRVSIVDRHDVSGALLSI